MLCCACLLETHKTMGIFDDLGLQLNVAEIINKHLWFKPQPNDLLTSQICAVCWDKIDDFHQFYQSVENAHKEFKQIQGKSTTANINSEDITSSSNCIKQEQDEVFHCNNPNQMELEIDNSDGKVLLIENLKNPLEDDNIEKTNNGSYTSDDYGPSEVSDKDACDNWEVPNHIKTKNAKNRNNRLKTPKSSIKPEKKNKNPSKTKKTGNILDPILTEEMILKHIPMGCNYCVFVGKTFHDIVVHFKKDHPKVRPHITCCDEKFTKRYFIAQHAMAHENPDCFRCEECKKSFKTVGNLKKHYLYTHATEEERPFACELCPQKFARQTFLQLHKPSHIPRDEWKFFCTKCPKQKSFASEHLLNIHDLRAHKVTINICNVCAKEIKNKKLFEKHVRAHYGDSGPRLKCPFTTCETWLKDDDSLKKHIRTIHNDDGKIFKCPECTKVCPNQKALSAHRAYVHSNKMFKCEQCEKTFKKAISLREHMARHTGEIIYSCPHCARTFNSNANMHNHKKNQHPVEWEIARRQKWGSGNAN